MNVFAVSAITLGESRLGWTDPETSLKSNPTECWSFAIYVSDSGHYCSYNSVGAHKSYGNNLYDAAPAAVLKHRVDALQTDRN